MKTAHKISWLNPDIIAGIALAIVLTLSLSGCGDLDSYLEEESNGFAGSSEHLMPLEYSEIRNKNASKREFFSTNEVPAIRISGCGGETVFFFLTETETLQFIMGRQVFVKEGQTLHWPFPEIKPGAYEVRLKAESIGTSSCTFRVVDEYGAI